MSAGVLFNSEEGIDVRTREQLQQLQSLHRSEEVAELKGKG